MSRHTEKFLALATFIAGMGYGAYSLENHLHTVTSNGGASPLAVADYSLTDHDPSLPLIDQSGE